MDVLILSQLFSVVITSVIGIRLLRLAGRTRETPELAIGLGFTLLGVVTSFAWIPLGVLGDELGAAQIPLALVGWLSLNCGGLCIAFFTWRVFRSGVLGGVLFFGCAIIGFGALAAMAIPDSSTLVREMGRVEQHHLGWWFGMLTRFFVYAWTATEALAYYAKMRRRRVLGLAESVMVNRFLLWGLAASCPLATYVILTVGALGGPQPGPVAGSIISVTSTLGAAIGNWLVFFAPRFYLRWIEGEARPS